MSVPEGCQPQLYLRIAARTGPTPSQLQRATGSAESCRYRQLGSTIPFIRTTRTLTVLQTDAAFAQLRTELLKEEGFSLPALRTLKLRQTSLSDASVNTLILLLPNVRRIDVSFTDIRRPLSVLPANFANLEKLCVTSTTVSPDDLISMLPAASRLHTLNIGALGGNHGKRSAYGRGISTMSFMDNHLRSLTAALSQNTAIENISLVANTKLARDEEAISEFVLLVGRRLKVRGGNTSTKAPVTHMSAEVEPVWTDISSVIGPATPRPC